MKTLGMILIACLPLTTLASALELPFKSPITVKPVVMETSLKSEFGKSHKNFSFTEKKTDGIEKWQDGLRKSLASSLPARF